jgi:hypothetical protein
VVNGGDDRIDAHVGIGRLEREAGLRLLLGIDLGGGVERFRRVNGPGLEFREFNAIGLSVAVGVVKSLASAGEGVSLGVDEALDFEGHLDIAAAVKALAGSAFIGLELRELRFPEAQDVGLDGADARHITDLEVEAIGDGRCLVEIALAGVLRGHKGFERRSIELKMLRSV